MVRRAGFWGRRLVRVHRSFTAEEVAAVEAAGAALTVSPTDPLPDGVVSVDAAGRSLVEEVAAGRDDIALPRLPFVLQPPSAPGASPRPPTSPTAASAAAAAAAAAAAGVPPLRRIPFTSAAREPGRAASARWRGLLNMRAEAPRFGTDVIVTALHAAVLGACPVEVVRAYLAAGADANVAEDMFSVPPLAHALAAGNLGVADVLLAGGAHANAVDGDGAPVLKYAFAAVAPARVEALAELEANPTAAAASSARHLALRGAHAAPGVVPVVDADGGSVAAAVDPLLAAGASPAVPDAAGNTALAWAAAGTFFMPPALRTRSVVCACLSLLEGDALVHVLEALHAAGARLEAGNHATSPPLHCALDGGRYDAAEALVALGASSATCDRGGHTACHVAARGRGGDATRSAALTASLLASGAGRRLLPAEAAGGPVTSAGDAYALLVDAALTAPRIPLGAAGCPTCDVPSLAARLTGGGVDAAAVAATGAPVAPLSSVGVAAPEAAAGGASRWTFPDAGGSNASGVPWVPAMASRYGLTGAGVCVVVHPAGGGVLPSYTVGLDVPPATASAVEAAEVGAAAAAGDVLTAAVASGDLPAAWKATALRVTPLAVAASRDPMAAALDAAAAAWRARAAAGHVPPITGPRRALVETKAAEDEA